MTGPELKQIRKQLQLTQQALAKRVGRTQKLVSLWETGHTKVPSAVADMLTDELRKRQPGSTPRMSGKATPQESRVFSWPPGLFELLWNDATKRVRHVLLEASLEPSRGHAGYADAIVRITFEGLEIPEGERLYLDHLGIPGSQFFLEKFEAKRAKVVPNLEISRTPSGDAAGERAQVALGPHVVAYEISEADSLDRVVITLRAKRGVDIKSMDGVGFPIYPDLLVERLTVQVTFQGLWPTPDPLVPRAFLIRRTAYRLHGLLKHFEMPTREQTEQGVRYTMGPLSRLRGGYLYGLAWEQLTRSPPTTGDDGRGR